MISKTWEPKTKGLGEHDFMFNVPPPSEKNSMAHADGPKKITPPRMGYGFKSPTAKNVITNWEDRWFSRRERESTFIYEWTVYKSDPPLL
tara:strand:+ start:430 stop:699 length:270 start_codon:yes stop_codon:yes gene_type:complete